MSFLTWILSSKPGTPATMFQKIVIRAMFVPSIVWNLVLCRFGYRNFCDRIDQCLVLGALPLTWVFSGILKRENIAALVSVNEDFELRYAVINQQRAAQMDLQHIQLRCPDFFGAPSLAQVVEGVNFIRRVKNTNSGGGSVYVHCKAGRSRSSCIVACYLMQEKNMTAKEAVAYIRARRPQIVIASHHWNLLMRFQHEVLEANGKRSLSSSKIEGEL